MAGQLTLWLGVMLGGVYQEHTRREQHLQERIGRLRTKIARLRSKIQQLTTDGPSAATA